MQSLAGQHLVVVPYLASLADLALSNLGLRNCQIINQKNRPVLIKDSASVAFLHDLYLCVGREYVSSPNTAGDTQHEEKKQYVSHWLKCLFIIISNAKVHKESKRTKKVGKKYKTFA
jgi:hypothetical protein